MLGLNYQPFKLWRKKKETKEKFQRAEYDKYKLVSYFWHPQSTPLLNPEDAAHARWMDGQMNRLVVVIEEVQKGQLGV